MEPVNKNIRILLVEDYPTNQQIASMYMETAGYIVDIAENGRQAVDAYKSGVYDIILMDIQMPEMDGYEATNIIRAFERDVGKRVIIIALTAHADKEDREKCLAAGMDDFIAKPLRRKTLLDMLDKWIVTGPDSGEVKCSEPTAEQEGNAEKVLTPVMDLDVVLDDFSGDMELLLEVSEEFIRSTRKRIDLIGLAIQSGNETVIRNEGHAIKGGAGNLCAVKLAETAYELESSVDSGDLVRSSELFRELANDFEDFVSFMNNIPRRSDDDKKLKKLLIVDDDRSIHLTYTKPLKANGFEVASAYDGIEAVRMVTEYQPDLIILDNKLPGRDGRDICKQLKSSPDTEHIKIIMFTSKDEEYDRLTGIEMGADEYLPKPYPFDFLAAAIKKQLGMHPYDNKQDDN